jgi:hypothetical protein
MHANPAIPGRQGVRMRRNVLGALLRHRQPGSVSQVVALNAVARDATRATDSQSNGAGRATPTKEDKGRVLWQRLLPAPALRVRIHRCRSRNARRRNQCPSRRRSARGRGRSAPGIRPRGKPRSCNRRRHCRLCRTRMADSRRRNRLPSPIHCAFCLRRTMERRSPAGRCVSCSPFRFRSRRKVRTRNSQVRRSPCRFRCRSRRSPSTSARDRSRRDSFARNTRSLQCSPGRTRRDRKTRRSQCPSRLRTFCRRCRWPGDKDPAGRRSLVRSDPSSCTGSSCNSNNAAPRCSRHSRCLRSTRRNI